MNFATSAINTELTCAELMTLLSFLELLYSRTWIWWSLHHWFYYFPVYYREAAL